MDVNNMNCRMYKNEYPKVDDIVVAQVVNIDDSIISCVLLEYNSMSAMLNYKNIKQRRNRGCPVKKGEIIYCVVSYVDNNYVDISKKHTTYEDVEITKERWKKVKMVHNLFKQVSYKTNTDIEIIYENFGWKLSENNIYDKLTEIYNNLEKMGEYDLSEDVINNLKIEIEKRFKPKEYVVRGQIEMMCFHMNGVMELKRVMRCGIKMYENVRIYYIAAPLYNIDYKTLDVEDGVEKLNKVIDKMSEEISKKGSIVVKMKPKIVEE